MLYRLSFSSAKKKVAKKIALLNFNKAFPLRGIENQTLKTVQGFLFSKRF